MIKLLWVLIQLLKMILMKIQIIKISIKYIQKVAVSTEEGINKVVLHVDNKYQVYPQMFKED